MVIELRFQLDFIRADLTYMYTSHSCTERRCNCRSASTAKQRPHSNLNCFGCMCLLHLWKWNIFLTNVLSRNQRDLTILFFLQHILKTKCWLRVKISRIVSLNIYYTIYCIELAKWSTYVWSHSPCCRIASHSTCRGPCRCGSSYGLKARKRFWIVCHRFCKRILATGFCKQIAILR